jgi:hypothetical protein
MARRAGCADRIGATTNNKIQYRRKPQDDTTAEVGRRRSHRSGKVGRVRALTQRPHRPLQANAGQGQKSAGVPASNAVPVPVPWIQNAFSLNLSL